MSQFRPICAGVVATPSVVTGVCRRRDAAAGVCKVARSNPTLSFFYTAFMWFWRFFLHIGDGFRHATRRRCAAASLPAGEGGFPPCNRLPHAGIAHEAGVARHEGDRFRPQDGGMVADFLHFAFDWVACVSLGHSVADFESLPLQIPPISVTERSAPGRFVPEMDARMGLQVCEFFQRRESGAGVAVEGRKEAAQHITVQNGSEFGYFFGFLFIQASRPFVICTSFRRVKTRSFRSIRSERKRTREFWRSAEWREKSTRKW